MEKRGSIYLVDMQQEQLKTLATVLNFIGETCIEVKSENLLNKVNEEKPLAVITQKQDLDLLKNYPKTPFLTISNKEQSDADPYLNIANHVGAIDLPVSYSQMMQLLHYCQSFSSPVQKSKKQNKYLIESLVGKGIKIQEIRFLIDQVADSKANVLILGDSGTGKEVVARAIHDISLRKKGPFVPVNCGAIPGELLESELFGHEKGAFTGAFAMRKGRFEMASGGTLFLDEIGDMPMPMQVKLLRVLQERTFERVGGGKTIKADVRIVAATHRNLEELIINGEFREDLYYRLNVFPIETPALKDRQSDIPLLLQELLSRIEGEHHGTLRFTQRALDSLMKHSWPGNVRELSNLLERLLILHANKIVDINELPLKYRHIDIDGNDVERIEYSQEEEDLAERDALCGIFSDHPTDHLFAGSDEPKGFANDLPSEGMDLKGKLMEFEIEMIRQALTAQDYVVSRAAELLSMRRTTLVEKMKKYGLSKEG